MLAAVKAKPAAALKGAGLDGGCARRRFRSVGRDEKMSRPNQKMRWEEEQGGAGPASNPRGADATEDRSTLATGPRRRKAADQDAGLFPIPTVLARAGIALLRRQSRERREAARNSRSMARRRGTSAPALPGEREILQAPVFLSAPRYVSYPAGAVSGSREPSRHRKSRIVSAIRRRSRLPPPRRRDSIQQQLANSLRALPRAPRYIP